MKRNRSKNVSALRRATIITQAIVFGSVVGVGVAAISVDTGLMYSAKAELQSAADASALAAASQLGAIGNVSDSAISAAASIAAANHITGTSAQVLNTDVVLGHATFDTASQRYQYTPNQHPFDAVRIKLRRDNDVSAGPISLAFGRALGINSASMTAEAVAVVAPRDISFVVDLSSSMNFDSQLHHYKNYQTPVGDSHGAVQVNLEDTWTKLSVDKGNNGVGNGIDPPPPGNPSNLNDQPGTGPGSPASKGGNPNPGANPTGGVNSQSGPRFGWMTGYGSSLLMGNYSPASDPGLYYIPKGSSTGDNDVASNLAECGYSSAEQSALKNSSNDANGNAYRNRVKVMLGIAGWRSGKSQRKYSTGGNADHVVDDGELTQQIAFNFGGGSWDDYIDYVSSSSTKMYQTDPNLRYRYGIKTVINYMLEKQTGPNGVADLVNTPEMPMDSVRTALHALVNRIVDNGFDDHVSLETYNSNSHHEMDLTVPAPGQNLSDMLYAVADKMKTRRAGHYDQYSNMGAGINAGMAELTSSRARSTAKKVLVLFTDGRPNVDSTNQFVGIDAASARSYALNRAQAAKNAGITVYCVGVGDGVSPTFLQQVSTDPAFTILSSGQSDSSNHGLPAYEGNLATILPDLGGESLPVKLIR